MGALALGALTLGPYRCGRRGRDQMKYEVVEQLGEWIVRRDGLELARFSEQLEALADVADRLHEAHEAEASYSLAVRYQARG